MLCCVVTTFYTKVCVLSSLFSFFFSSLRCCTSNYNLATPLTQGEALALAPDLRKSVFFLTNWIGAGLPPGSDFSHYSLFSLHRAQTKKTSRKACLICMSISSKLDRAFNLIGTEASCTDIDMAGGTVNDRLHALNVRLPRPICTPMRMGNLNTESNTLTANIALCQLLHLQS